MNKKEVLDAISQEFQKSLQDIDVTNGEVIKAMFPSIHMIEVFPKVHLFINNCMVARIDINMWNAPYKYRKEQTDESKI